MDKIQTADIEPEGRGQGRANLDTIETPKVNTVPYREHNLSDSYKLSLQIYGLLTMYSNCEWLRLLWPSLIK